VASNAAMIADLCVYAITGRLAWNHPYLAASYRFDNTASTTDY